MHTHLNTLYVTTQGAYLAKDGDTVLVRVEKETRLRVPLHTLDALVCFGNVSCSPALLGACATAGVAIAFLTLHGRFLARVQGPVSGNVLLRRQQYRAADHPARTADLARAIIAGKIANARAVLLRGGRDHPDLPGAAPLATAADHLQQSLRRLATTTDADALRGLEGDAARIYFGVFAHLIVAQTADFTFTGRSRRPPLDPVNALLSFLYTLLGHDCAAALEAAGLDPAVGFLHRDRPGRLGLALDLMEELRPLLADRLALSLINLKQLTADSFQRTETGAVHLTDPARKTLLVAYQKRKQEPLQHPFTGDRVSLGLVPFLQARLLARHLRGDLDAYPPFTTK